MTDLAHVLRQLPPANDDRLLVGSNPADDAAVYRLDDETALVQSVDFFTPIVDDPWTFGRIAVANSLSDIYAMGGTPLLALNVVAFPLTTLSGEILTQILLGGAEMAREAGVTIAGGHTVEDAEPKYGLAVTGTVNPDNFMTARGAVPGDLLVLTKPLGTGTISTALKAESAEPQHVRAAVSWMATLNRSAGRAMMAASADAATDVTGFGLLGHLRDMCAASRVAATVSLSACPLLPGALDYQRKGFVPAGTANNLAAIGGDLVIASEAAGGEADLLADPQTSGGLLVALKPQSLDQFRQHAARDMLTAVIGSITPGPPGRITITP